MNNNTGHCRFAQYGYKNSNGTLDILKGNWRAENGAPQVSQVPVPAGGALLLTALIGFGLCVSRNRKKA